VVHIRTIFKGQAVQKKITSPLKNETDNISRKVGKELKTYSMQHDKKAKTVTTSVYVVKWERRKAILVWWIR
jgi:hypothetical protein